MCGLSSIALLHRLVSYLFLTRISSSPQRLDPFLGPPNCLFDGYRCSRFQELRRLWLEGDQPLPSSAEIKRYMHPLPNTSSWRSVHLLK
jgi:hypothetical protein